MTGLLKLRATGWFLALVVGAMPLGAQTRPDTGATLIHAGRFFDSEAGVFRANQDILIRDQKIERVGPNLEAPKGARVIDLRKYTVLPGLIDAHMHLLYLEDPAGGISMEGAKSIIIEGTPLRALHAAARARTFLEAGITTVRDLGNSGRFGDVALRDAINDGSVDGPRLLVSGPGLSAVGGQWPGLQANHADIAAEEYRIVHGPADAADAVRENVTFGAQVIKIYSNNTPNPAYLSVDEMKAIVEAAKRHGVRVAAHATDDAAVWRAAFAGVNSIEHAYRVEDSTLALMAKNGVTLTPTDIDSLTVIRYSEKSGPNGFKPRPEQISEILAGQRDRLRRAVKAGVTITAGSDNYLNLGWPQGRAAKRNLFAYLASGLTAIQVLQAATINDARLLGLEGKVGVLKAGAFADIIAIEGDVEKDSDALERVRFVMKSGTVYLGKP